jgi:hypothetical protein
MFILHEYGICGSWSRIAPAADVGAEERLAQREMHRPPVFCGRGWAWDQFGMRPLVELIVLDGRVLVVTRGGERVRAVDHGQVGWARDCCLVSQRPSGRSAAPEDEVGLAASFASRAPDHVNGHVLAAADGYLALRAAVAAGDPWMARDQSTRVLWLAELTFTSETAGHALKVASKSCLQAVQVARQAQSGAWETHVQRPRDQQRQTLRGAFPLEFSWTVVPPCSAALIRTGARGVLP